MGMKKKRTILLDLGGVAFQSTEVDSEYIDRSVITQLNRQFSQWANKQIYLFDFYL
jgi:uridylate kinase